ncbi:helix-turn-helix domain-containing protein [Pseudomonas aeruginosa]|uniref:helix-turn-helix domain-containing protein n=1 Tax=Pseudomonas aeruginosa TaxID=287 RepID=UPI0039C4BE97
MKETFSIGPAILRRRLARGWSMQKTCDEAGNALYPSFLSAVEKQSSMPSVAIAYALAKAFGTTVDALIEEAIAPGSTPAPAESAKRVPVIPWELAAEWAKSPVIERLPTGTPWVLPPDNPPGAVFGLTVRDDTMHAPSGPAFPVGSVIFVDPRQEAEANDLVVGYTVTPSEPTFKKLIQDGSQRYLRPLNPQFPPISVDGNFQVIGVVTGMQMRIAKGLIR